MAPETPQTSTLSRLIVYLKRYKVRMSAGLACVIATSGLALANPWVIRYGIDSLSEEVTRTGLLFYAGLIVGLTVLQGISRFLMRWLMIGVSRRIEYHLRTDVFEHMEGRIFNDSESLPKSYNLIDYIFSLGHFF